MARRGIKQRAERAERLRLVPKRHLTTFGHSRNAEDGAVCLTLTGESRSRDRPRLHAPARELRVECRSVVIDLSALEFMDSTRLGALLQAATAARRDGWELAIRRELSPQVRRLFELVRVARMLFD